MSSTAAASNAPKPAQTSAKPAQAGERAHDRKTEAADIFSSLLSLLANTQVLPEAATVSRAASDKSTSDPDAPDGTDNPMAALLGWGLQGAADAALGKKASTQGADATSAMPAAAGQAQRAGAGSEGKIDISDLTPVESTPVDLLPKGAVALPANAARPGAPFVPLARAADAPTNSVPGTQWRRASLSSTETLSLQQAANQAALTQPMRSTVALNERFGLAPGIPLTTSERREATADGFSLSASFSTSSSTNTRSPEGATALPGALSGEGAMGSDSSGADGGSFDRSDGQADNPFAEANTGEEPTVTHWGTQHLRHAKLSVSGEAGEQAIDIQLSMKGQEVQVEFKTDNAEARASLRENAGESLSDLLSKSGMQLGGVSVGAQGQPGSRGDEAPARQNGVRGAVSGPQMPATAAMRPAHLSPRADGSQPLDVFA